MSARSLAPSRIVATTLCSTVTANASLGEALEPAGKSTASRRMGSIQPYLPRYSGSLCMASSVVLMQIRELCSLGPRYRDCQGALPRGYTEFWIGVLHELSRPSCRQTPRDQ